MDYKYKFSVIIPIYNVEKYLEETIQSVIDQTIGFEDNIQMILVNDGSPDNSEKVCKEYKTKYPNNIIYIKQKNAGVSTARNNGLKYAEGEIVNFLDSDDKWELDAFEKVYNFFQNNYDEIDVVACRLKFFDAKKGFNHPLNYKFKSNYVVDLRKNPNNIQMHVCSSFVKKDSIEEDFDSRLKYAEDSLFVNKIILKKLKYGIMRKTIYMYRKRPDESSAIDKSLTSISYYTDTLNYFHDELIRYSKELYGNLNLYTQYVIMYDLQWRLKVLVTNYLEKEEVKKYKNHIKKLLKEIDDSVILSMKNIWIENKVYALNLKYGYKILNKSKLDDDGRLFFKDNRIYNLKNNSLLKLMNLNIRNKKLVIAGQVNCLLDRKKYDIYISINGIKKKIDLKSSEFAVKNGIDKKLYANCVFSYTVKSSSVKIISFYIKYQNKFIKLNPQYTHNFRLNSMFELHYSKDGYMVYLNHKDIVFQKYSFSKSFILEFKTIIKLIKIKKYSHAFIRILVKIMKVFKHKKIWLITDRPIVANDNGMHLFKYISTLNNNEEEVYFVIDKKCDDYNKMKKYGKVIDYSSFKYKLYFLLADKNISSQADQWVLNPFGKSSIYYRDLYPNDFVFLQHGVTKDDVSDWLNLFNKNIAMFVTTAIPEYQSILDGNYCYDKSVVKLTGLPRFDNLKDESKKVIAIMPTWRKMLSGEYDSNTCIRKYNNEFVESDYFKFYNKLINDKKLIKKMKEKGYKGIFTVHPLHMENAKDFNGNDVFEIVKSFADYQKIFRESNLLVTDYSSVAFDFAYLRKPVIYTQFDKEEFFSSHTYAEGYFDYNRDGFGPVIYTYDEAQELIIRSIDNDFKIQNRYKKRIDSFYKYNDRKNCKRVYEEIKKI